MGVPLICNSNVGDTDLIVSNYKAGKVIDAFDIQTYKDNLIDPNEFDSKEIAAGAKDYFALSEGVNRFLDVYAKIYE